MRVAPARIVGLWLFAAGCAGLAGCGGDGSNITRTRSTALQQRADGSLMRQPDPLSVEDLERLPGDSAQSAVVRLWFYVQWGDSSSTARFYDPRVLRTIGDATVAGAYSLRRLEMLDSRPRVRSETRNAAGTLVTVDVLTTSAPPRPEFFLLRHRAVGWRIVYDSLLEKALPSYIQAQKQFAVAPGNNTPSPDATTAGAAAVKQYRQILFSDLAAARAAELRSGSVAQE